MSTALLIVVAVVLTFLVMRSRASPKDTKTGGVQPQVVVVRDTPAVLPVEKMESAPSETVQKIPTYEEMALDSLRDQTESFFVSPKDGGSTGVPTCTKGNTYAKSEYGGADDFKDFVAKQNLDERVVDNHKQWVKERKSVGPVGEFTTGRTYSPDSHDSYDPTPWQGIRGRPRAVPVTNPTQVPDVDVKLFKGENPYRFFA